MTNTWMNPNSGLKRTVTSAGSFRKEVPNTSTWSRPPNTKYGPEQAAYNQLFFSGQDVYVFLAPYYSKSLVPIPVTAFAFGVSQEKAPIYGAWSYMFDAIAKGVKIVRGEFSIVFTEPNFIGQSLGQMSQTDYPKKKPLTSENVINPDSTGSAAIRRELREKIWGSTTKDYSDYLTDTENSRKTGTHQPVYPFGRTAWAKAAGKHEAEYAGHQPFDIIITFGNNPSMRMMDNSVFDFDTWALSAQDHMRMVGNDANEEFQQGWKASERIHIQNVELMSVGTQYDVSGQPLQESYVFMARDAVTPAGAGLG